MNEFEEDYKELVDAFGATIKEYTNYNFICYNNKIEREHRLKMELYLDRKLNKDEIIHHINLDKRDNNINNLIILRRSKHRNVHGSLTKIGLNFCKLLYDKGYIFFDEFKEIYKIRDKKYIEKNLFLRF